jgi:hypothetical protein
MTETATQQFGNVKDILNMMNKANEGFNYAITIPSLGRNVMFRQINTSQQKRLLKSIIDNPAFNTEFIYVMRQIITENCVEDIKVDDLTIYDKMIICMVMRSSSIGDDFEIQFTPEGSAKPIATVIKLRELAERALDTIKIEPKTIVDDTGTFEVLCDLPTIQDEYKLEDALRKHVSNIEINNVKELRTTIGDIFTNELVKYIKQVNIKNSLTSEVAEVSLKAVEFKDRLSILENLPAKVTNKIAEYINNINKQFESILLFKYLIPAVKDEEGNIKVAEHTIEQRLKIDANFFTAS